MTRKQVNLKSSTYLQLDKIRGNKTFDQTVSFILSKYQKVKKLELEIEKLKQQLVGISADKSNMPSITERELAEKYPCLSRFEWEAIFYCVSRKAHASVLVTLKICSKCLWRHTDKALTIKRSYFWNCGAKENYDKKKGLMVYCEKHFQGSWVTPQQCKDAKCQLIKEVQIA